MFNEIKNTAKVLLSLGLICASVLPSNPVNAQTRKYSVTAWIEITGCTDDIVDHSLEIYGNARIDGVKKWEIKRDNAVDKECGNTIQVLTNHPDSSPNFYLDLKLQDRDRGTADDLIGEFVELINVNQQWYQRTWDNGNGEASKLVINVKPG